MQLNMCLSLLYGILAIFTCAATAEVMNEPACRTHKDCGKSKNWCDDTGACLSCSKWIGDLSASATRDRPRTCTPHPPSPLRHLHPPVPPSPSVRYVIRAEDDLPSTSPLSSLDRRVGPSPKLVGRSPPPMSIDQHDESLRPPLASGSIPEFQRDTATYEHKPMVHFGLKPTDGVMNQRATLHLNNSTASTLFDTPRTASRPLQNASSNLNTYKQSAPGATASATMTSERGGRTVQRPVPSMCSPGASHGCEPWCVNGHNVSKCRGCGKCTGCHFCISIIAAGSNITHAVPHADDQSRNSLHSRTAPDLTNESRVIPPVHSEKRKNLGAHSQNSFASQSTTTPVQVDPDAKLYLDWSPQVPSSNAHYVVLAALRYANEVLSNVPFPITFMASFLLTAMLLLCIILVQVPPTQQKQHGEASSLMRSSGVPWGRETLYADCEISPQIILTGPRNSRQRTTTLEPIASEKLVCLGSDAQGDLILSL